MSNTLGTVKPQILPNARPFINLPVKINVKKNFSLDANVGVVFAIALQPNVTVNKSMKFHNTPNVSGLFNALESNKPSPSSWLTLDLITSAIFPFAINLKINFAVNIKKDTPFKLPNPSISEPNFSRLILFAITIPSPELRNSSTSVKQSM